jgi:hypothetical protein
MSNVPSGLPVINALAGALAIIDSGIVSPKAPGKVPKLLP